MKRLLFTLSFALLMCLPAQATVAISASHVSDSFGNDLASARLCFTPVNAADQAQGFRVGSFQVVPTEACGKVTTGALAGGLVLQPSPVGMFYHIRARAANSNTVLMDYGMTPITGSTWTLDTYDPAFATVPVATITFGTLTVLSPGSGGSCALVGPPYVLNCSIPGGTTGATGATGATGIVSVAGSGTEIQVRNTSSTLTAVTGSSWNGTTLALPQISIGGGSAISTSNATGSGSLVKAISPALVTPALGVATATSIAIGGGATLATSTMTGSGNIVGSNSPSITTPNIAGVANGSNAPAGNYGELATGQQLTPQSLVSGLVINITSVTLTAGDWDVWGIVQYSGTTTTPDHMRIGIATVNNNYNTLQPDFLSAVFNPITGSPTGSTLAVGPARFSISGTTTYYLNTDAGFTAGTLLAAGTIRARRVR